MLTYFIVKVERFQTKLTNNFKLGYFAGFSGQTRNAVTRGNCALKVEYNFSDNDKVFMNAASDYLLPGSHENYSDPE